jgi:hypothetical protein
MGQISLLGVAGHFLHHDLFYPESYTHWWRIENTLPRLKKLGVTTVHEQLYLLTNPARVLVSDGRTDPAVLQKMHANRQLVSDWLGQYDAAGIKVVLSVLASPPSAPRAAANNAEFSTWVAELIAAHPSVIAVQMHNEPNLSQFWVGTPEQYVDVFRPYAARIKALRPDVQMLGGAVSGFWWQPGVDWLKRAVDHGLLEFSDGIVMHPYNVDWPPEVDPHWTGLPKQDPEHREKALRAFWDLVGTWNTTGKPLTLHFTEFGYNTATTGIGHVTEDQQANYLSRCFFIFQDVRLRGVPLESACWYDFKDDGTINVGSPPDNPQYRYALTSYDLTYRKPAFFALQALAKYFGDTSNFEATDLEVVPVAPAPATLKLKTWRRKSDGANIIAVWNSDPAVPSTTIPTIKLDVDLPSAGTVLQYIASRSTASTRAKRIINGKLRVESVKFSTRASWLEIQSATDGA